MPSAWFALLVREQSEWEVLAAIRRLGFTAWTPCQTTSRYRDEPLFPGVVLAEFPWGESAGILRIQGVQAVAASGLLPDPVRNETVDSLRILCSSGLPVQPWPYHFLGERVEIGAGPLTGLIGMLVHDCGPQRAVVALPPVRRAVSAVIEPAWLRKPIGLDAPPGAGSPGRNGPWDPSQRPQLRLLAMRTTRTSAA